MGDYLIDCVLQDQYLRITHVGVIVNGIRNVYTVQQAIQFMSSGDTFYTYKDGYRATVFAKQNDITRPYFLTTSRDETRENNLDFLPHCR